VVNILTFTTLYPNCEQKRHGIFVEQRLRQLLYSNKVRAIVVAPIPWFPFSSDIFGKYGAFARVPTKEQRYGITVLHPRYLTIPKVGMTVAPLLMALAMKRVFKQINDAGYKYHVIDAHYFYPDGVAAAILGKWLSKPIVITARGSDINLIPKYYLPRKMILWAARKVKKVIAVSQALKNEMVKIGIPESRIKVLRNGVDLHLFYPVSKVEVRQKLNIKNLTLLSVGNLIESKGHHIVIKALKKLPEVKLVVIGDGIMSNQLKRLVNTLKISDRVTFIGEISQQELKDYYNAVDILVLASSREGMPNVLTESIACGTPVITTAAGGAPEVVLNSAVGILMQERTPQAVAKAFRTLMKQYPDREYVRAHAEKFDWEQTSMGLYKLFSVIAR
jgi:teichuronic acid biosynthesis glycosyltransferase TuaC